MTAAIADRTRLFDLMAKLKLFGMRSACEEVMGIGIMRQHEPLRIVGDLLNAEFDFTCTPINEGLVKDLASGAFIASPRNAVLVSGPGKTHLAIAIARFCIRGATRGRFFHTVDLVSRLESETGRAVRDVSPVTCHVSTSSCSTNSEICPSPSQVGSSSSI